MCVCGYFTAAFHLLWLCGLITGMYPNFTISCSPSFPKSRRFSPRGPAPARRGGGPLGEPLRAALRRRAWPAGRARARIGRAAALRVRRLERLRQAVPSTPARTRARARARAHTHAHTHTHAAFLRDLFALDPVALEWAPLSPPGVGAPPPPRDMFGFAAAGGGLFVLGGSGGGGQRAPRPPDLDLPSRAAASSCDGSDGFRACATRSRRTFPLG